MDKIKKIKPYPHFLRSNSPICGTISINLHCFVILQLSLRYYAIPLKYKLYVLLTPRHKPGNKRALFRRIISLGCIHTLKWQHRKHSSGNSLPISDESSNAPIFVECSWTKPWDAPLISSPAFRYICDSS